MKKMLTCLALAFSAGLCSAQEFPTQSIRMVIPYAPGGGSDILARPIAPEMGRLLKQPIVIDNRGGAAGNIGSAQVAHANPDGYTLVMANNSQVINPFMYKTPGYQMADFAPISLVGTSPVIVVVHKSMPVSTIPELIAYAKQNPGKLNFGMPGAGTPGHLASLLFSKQAEISVVHVPYKGSGPTTLALLSREVDVFFATPAAVDAYIKSGDFKALAVTSRQRFSAYPQVPTVVESGVPALASYSMDIWWGLLAPARTDPAVLDKLHDAVVSAASDPKIKDAWIAQGMVPTTTSRAEFQTLIKNELVRWEKVVRENHITAAE